MSKTASGPASARRPASGLLVGLAVLTPLAGCGHRDVIDTPIGWWHQLQGGAIAEQRPPPPGVDAPYPHIGTTPAAAPQVASVELRHSVTDQLIEQRNLSTRLNAHDPLPPPVTTPAKAAKAPQPPTASLAPANPAMSSATLDAAEAPAVPQHSPPAPDAPSTLSQPGAPAAQADAELAMPDIVPPASAGPAGGPNPGPVVLPPIPDAPPPAPGLPGIVMPPPPSYVPPPRPAYQLTQAPGDTLQFATGSDVLGPGQAGALRAIASRRAGGSIFVHGYGDAASDAPADQSQALTLAALRARSVADALEKVGVPSSAIRIRANAFGRGAIASTTE